MSIGVTMLPTRDYVKGMLIGSLAFLGLSFCSPPAPAFEVKKLLPQADKDCLALNMYWEARNQPWDGIVAVGEVTLNRVADSRYPDNICDVVFQGPSKLSWKGTGELIPVRHRCQFSWYCDGKSDKVPDIDDDLWFAIVNKASKLIGTYNWGARNDITKGSTHYHADYVYPEWASSKTKIKKIGNHIFYKWEKR